MLGKFGGFVFSTYFCSPMKRFFYFFFLLLISVSGWCQTLTDTRCMTLMDVPLEGADSVFIPALKSAGFEQVKGESDDPDTYYFYGDFYGIRSKLMVTVDEKTKLLSDVTVTCGPYRTRELFDKNQKYLLLKLQREWGDFKAKGDGSLHTMTDYGYIRQSVIFDEEGRRSIRYFYLNMSPYYKDAANMGLKGAVQEVITENPVAENGIEHFDESGRLEGSDLIDRHYNGAGYLVSAAMLEQSGEKSLLTYEYDEDNNLRRRTLVNEASGIRSVNEYKYNGSNEITQQSQKVFNRENECVMSINIKHNPEERDDNGNWTKNTLTLTYWEKDQRAQMATVHQTRVISYWDED